MFTFVEKFWNETLTEAVESLECTFLVSTLEI